MYVNAVVADADADAVAAVAGNAVAVAAALAVMLHSIDQMFLRTCTPALPS